MQFERVDSKLKRSFYEQNKSSGISINTENVFWTKTVDFTFSKGENVLRKYAMDCGFNLLRTEGLLSKTARAKGYRPFWAVDQARDGLD